MIVDDHIDDRQNNLLIDEIEHEEDASDNEEGVEN